jgi:type I site-specific restriction endonuclease
MNEAETRAECIDPALKDAGWGAVEGSRILREYPITLGRLEGFGRRGKALTADYVLVYRKRPRGQNVENRESVAQNLNCQAGRPKSADQFPILQKPKNAKQKPSKTSQNPKT